MSEAGRRIDAAIGFEVQTVREVTVIFRRSRPIAAAVADIAQTASSVVAITRSRVPDGLVGTKLAGEVHAFVGAVI